jgi:hypothetical protein
LRHRRPDTAGRPCYNNALVFEIFADESHNEILDDNHFNIEKFGNAVTCS